MKTEQLIKLEAIVKMACTGHDVKVDLMTKEDLQMDEGRIEVHGGRVGIQVYENGRNRVRIEVIGPMLEDSYLSNAAVSAFWAKRYSARGDPNGGELVLEDIPRNAAYIENTIRDINAAFEKFAHIMDDYEDVLDEYGTELYQVRL